MTRGFLDEDERRSDDNADFMIEEVSAVHATRNPDGSVKAVRCAIAGREHALWVPFSVITDDSEVYDVGHAGKLIVKGWWARQAGLE